MVSDSQNGGNSEPSQPHKRMRKALRAVRREVWKAATIYAVVDSVAVFLTVNLLLAALEPAELPTQIAVPTAVTEPIAAAVGRSIQTVTIPGSAVVALVVGVVVFVGDLWLRVRRPLVEQFEAVNPSVSEALRTARDVIDDGNSRMATRLYENVLESLRESSSVALVDFRRIVVTLVVIVAVSLATVQVAAVDLALLDGSGEPTTPTREQPRNFTGLEDGDAVLGDPEDVQAGDENLTAQIESTSGEQEVNRSQQFPTDNSGGGSSSFDSQQSGFADPEQLEDAELIREYNLRIRAEEED